MNVLVPLCLALILASTLVTVTACMLSSRISLAEELLGPAPSFPPGNRQKRGTPLEAKA